MALTDNSVIDYLYIPSSDPGNSGSAFGEPLDQYGNDLKYYYKSAVLGMSGDDLQLLLPDRIRNPDHIKIDVDNIEDKIIQGLLNNVLNNSNIKSILVEIDNTFQGKKYIIEKMLYSKGFINYSYDKEATTEDLKCTTYNYIFRKGVNNKMKKTH